MLYVVLAVFARYRLRYELDDSSDSEDAPSVYAEGESSSGSDSDSTRQEYIRKVVLAQKSGQNSGSSVQRERFRGPPENAQLLPHKKRGVPLYKECMSKTWRKQDPKHAQLYKKAPSCPSTFTVLDLLIPDELIPAEDEGWLGGY